MGAQIQIKEQSAVMIRKVGTKLVKEERVQNLYVVPPRNEYEFEITGYAEPFEMQKAEEYGGGMQIMTRVELTITKGPGKGKMFDQLWGFTIGPKSNLGRFLRSMHVDLTTVDGMWDLDRMIGYTGSGYVTPGDQLGPDGKPKYARLALDTVQGISGPDRDYAYREEPTEDDFAVADPGSFPSNGNGAMAATDDGWPEG